MFRGRNVLTRGDFRMNTYEEVVRTVVLGSLMVAIACAQSYSALIGRVVDPSGQVTPGAKILLENPDTRAERRTVTNIDGNYEIAALPAGTYRMEVTAA